MPTDVYSLSHFKAIVWATYFIPVIRYLAVEYLLTRKKTYSLKTWHLMILWNSIQIFLLWSIWTELRLEGSLSLGDEDNLRAFLIRLMCYLVFVTWDLIAIKIFEVWRRFYLGILISDFLMVAISSYVWLQL